MVNQFGMSLKVCFTLLPDSRRDFPQFLPDSLRVDWLVSLRAIEGAGDDDTRIDVILRGFRALEAEVRQIAHPYGFFRCRVGRIPPRAFRAVVSLSLLTTASPERTAPRAASSQARATSAWLRPRAAKLTSPHFKPSRPKLLSRFSTRRRTSVLSGSS